MPTKLFVMRAPHRRHVAHESNKANAVVGRTEAIAHKGPFVAW